MTREQAINYLYSSGFSEGQVKAVVEALTDEDAISREEVHDLLVTWLNDYLTDETRDALEVIDAKIEDLPSVTPSRRKGHWIDVKDQMPEPLQAVIVTWKNHMPEPYYSDIKHKPFVGVAIYYRDKWWWWSAYTEDMLAEYGRSDSDKVDDAIEITAWMPLPKADMRGDTDAVN